MLERLKIDLQPKKLRIESEPYVMFVRYAFVPVINVYDIKAKREYYLIIAASSLSKTLKQWMDDNDDKLLHIEFWVNKESDERTSKYEVEMA